MPSRPLFGSQDVVAIATLVFGTPLAAILSDDWLRRLPVALAQLLPAGFRQVARTEDMMALGGLSREEAVAIQRHQLEQRLISLAFFLKELVRNRGYATSVDGSEHIAAALAKGRGAVIWIADFVFASEITRAGFHAIGRPLTHIFRPEHGFSPTRFGLRYLNPIRFKVEAPYLHERILFQRDDARSARRRLEARLAENGLVSMLACAYEGRVLADVPILGGRIAIAAGAPALAFKAQCPILPVFTLPSPEAPRFVLRVDEPLVMTATTRETAILQATTDFAARLTPYVKAHPHLWRGWASLAADEAASTARLSEEFGHASVKAASVPGE